MLCNITRSYSGIHHMLLNGGVPAAVAIMTAMCANLDKAKVQEAGVR